MTNLETLQIIWDALHDARQSDIDNGYHSNIDDERWDSICTAMAHLHEHFNINHEDIK